MKHVFHNTNQFYICYFRKVFWPMLIGHAEGGDVCTRFTFKYKTTLEKCD